MNINIIQIIAGGCLTLYLISISFKLRKAEWEFGRLLDLILRQQEEVKGLNKVDTNILKILEDFQTVQKSNFNSLDGKIKLLRFEYEESASLMSSVSKENFEITARLDNHEAKIEELTTHLKKDIAESTDIVSPTLSCPE